MTTFNKIKVIISTVFVFLSIFIAGGLGIVIEISVAFYGNRLVNFLIIKKKINNKLNIPLFVIILLLGCAIQFLIVVLVGIAVENSSMGQ